MNTHLTPGGLPTPENYLLDVQTVISNLEALNEMMETVINWAGEKFAAAERTRSRELLISAAAERRVLTILKRANVLQARVMDDSEKETLAALVVDLEEAEEEMAKLVQELGKLLSSK